VPRKRKTTISSTSIEDTAAIQASFDKAFLSLDAAVAGALIAGVHPSAFEPALMDWFALTAAAVRGFEETQFKQKFHDRYFDRMLECIIEFVDDGGFDLVCQPEQTEFHALKERCLTGIFGKMPELDRKRHSGQADAVIRWVTDSWSYQDDLPLLMCELALLVQWLKVTAISGAMDYDVYVCVRRTIPLVLNRYNEILLEG
jgi:hypothetical protein